MKSSFCLLCKFAWSKVVIFCWIKFITFMISILVLLYCWLLERKAFSQFFPCEWFSSSTQLGFPVMFDNKTCFFFPVFRFVFPDFLCFNWCVTYSYFVILLFFVFLLYLNIGSLVQSILPSLERCWCLIFVFLLDHLVPVLLCSLCY